MSHAQRPMPSIFLNASTYGIADAGENRLPAMADTDKGSLPGIILPDKGLSTVLCIAGLQKAVDFEDIARLVIGAIVECSGVSPTVARLEDPFKGSYGDVLRGWITSRLYDDDGNVRADPRAAASAGTDDVPFPSDLLPAWYNELGVSEADVLEAASADPTELYAYAGILALSVAKTPSAQNLEAFNSKRRRAVEQFMPGKPMVLFVDGSKYLDLETLTKSHRAFNLWVKDRALVIGAVVDADKLMVDGRPRIFYAIFRLASGASLNSILIILKFARQHSHFYSHFPHLTTEYAAAALALERFFEVAPARRLYLKAIFGSAYIPVPRQDIANLLKIAICTLQFSEPSLINFGGDGVDSETRSKIMTLLGLQSSGEETVIEDNA